MKNRLCGKYYVGTVDSRPAERAMTSPVQGVLEHLRRAARRQHDAARSDGELLTCYIARRDEAAFEGLVRRHGPMVYGVCRRLLRSEADAEDAFQATFLVFIRKAASIRPREKTANWLYGVAYHTAQKARDAAMKRRVKERQAGENPRPEAPEDIWGPLLPLLDQEIHRLPEHYRLAVVLCDLEGKSHKNAALQLGWPQGTLSGRLSRARALLRRRLARQGLALGAGAFAPSVGSAALPMGLTTATVKAALAFAAGSAAGVVSVKVIALTEGTVKAMLLTKLYAMTAVLLAVTLAGVGTAVAVSSMPGKEVRAPMDPDHAKAAPTPKADGEAASDADEKAVRDYVAELRAAVKNPADDKHIYRLVIDPRWRTAVHWAERRGEDALAVELYRDYCGPNNPDKGGTALTGAVGWNDQEGAKILLDRKVDVNAQDRDGRSALHQATRWGVEITRLLLDHGANVNARDNEGRTALMLAAEGGRLDVAKALLAEGANVRLKDKKGKTALDLVKPGVLPFGRFRSDEAEKEYQAQLDRDAKALPILLERAGGAMP
jgi:RNA polymerase sigma factor (sigma-70 family)